MASQPGGGKSVTFADSAEAEPVAGPRQPVAVAALESSAGRGALQPGTRVTFADVLKSSSGRPAHQPGSKAATAAGSRLLATGPRAGTEQLATEACQQEGSEVVALKREVASLKEKIGHLESVLRGRL